jgi:cytochrome c2
MPFEQDYVKFVRSIKGNAKAGYEIFFESQRGVCDSCHQVKGKGGKIGPDFSQISRLYYREDLAKHVLYPSHTV